MIESKAKWLHDRYLEDRSKEGWHYYEKHINPFEVPPQRRADGKTMCDFCDLWHLPYEQLDEPRKEKWRKQILRFEECLKAHEGT